MKIDGQAVFRCGAGPYNGPGIIQTHLEKSLVQGPAKARASHIRVNTGKVDIPLIHRKVTSFFRISVFTN